MPHLVCGTDGSGTKRGVYTYISKYRWLSFGTQIGYSDAISTAVMIINKEIEMKVKTVVLLAAVLLAVWGLGTALAGEVTITGEVNGDYQIVADNGDVYDVAEDEKGDDLVANVGKKVEVQGTLMEEDGSKTLKVVSFKVIE